MISPLRSVLLRITSYLLSVGGGGGEGITLFTKFSECSHTLRLQGLMLGDKPLMMCEKLFACRRWLHSCSGSHAIVANAGAHTSCAERTRL